jgi:thiamine-phosphate pyrophosphorylase
MMLCLVTDRRRLGRAIEAAEADWNEALQQQVEAAASAGIDYVQVREPDLEARDLIALVRSLAACTRSSRTRLVVNDRLDVALAAGADGVHLKERSILPAEARRIAPPGFVIGCSVHGVDAVAARKGADFLIAGTVLPTASKPSVDYLSKDGLGRIVEAAAGQPVLGIGGLDVRSIPLLASTCAAGLAAVGAFIPATGEDLAKFVQNRVTAMRLAFDSVSGRP